MSRPDAPVPDAGVANTPPPDEPVVHHTTVREKRRKGPGQEKMELSLTSMIDVIFLLLIYFVITASFMINEGILSASLPQGPAVPQDVVDDKQPVFIELTPAADDTQVIINVDGQQFSGFADLYQYLANQLHAPELGKPGGIYPVDNPMVIRPRGQVRWQHVVATFNALVRAKYEVVSFGQPQ